MPVLQMIILSTAVLNILLGLIVLNRNIKSKINLTFFIFALTAGLWSLVNFFELRSPSIYLARATHAFGIFMAASALSWVIVFCRGEKKSLLFAVISYITGFILFGFSFSPFVIEYHFGLYTPAGMSLKYGFLFPIFAFSAAFIFTLSLGIFLYNFTKARGFRRSQIRFILFGVFLFGTSALLLGVVLPFFGINSFSMLDSPATLFFVGFIAYAIIKHRLMDIRAVILKSVVYTFLVAIIGGLYVFLVYYLKRYYESIINPDIAFILAGFIIALGFQPLKKALEKSTDKIFAKGSYNFSELLRKLGNVLSSALTKEEITRPTLELLTKEMKVRQAFFVLTSSPEVSYVESTSNGQNHRENCPRLAQWNKLSRLIDGQKTIVTDELEEGPKKAGLRNFHLEVVVSLWDEKESLTGFLALSEKRSGETYSAQDLKLLEIMAPQISMALRNTQRQKEIINRVIEERQRIHQDAHDRIYNRLGGLAKTCEAALLEPPLVDSTLANIPSSLRKTVVALKEIVGGGGKSERRNNGSQTPTLSKLKKILKEHQKESGQKVEFLYTNGVVGKLAPNHHWHLQCILQEGLNNARKHSQAKKVKVSLKLENGDASNNASKEYVKLIIADDGIGFSELKNLANLPDGCQGLRGMQKRAKEMNGEFFVQSDQNGTQISVMAPMS